MKYEKTNFNITVADNGYIVEVTRPHDPMNNWMEDLKNQAIDMMRGINEQDGDEWKKLVDKQVEELKEEAIPAPKPYELLTFKSHSELIKFWTKTHSHESN